MRCVPPTALVCVVRVDGTPYLCQTDEVGEICVSSSTTAISYYGLPGMTKNIFEVRECSPCHNLCCVISLYVCEFCMRKRGRERERERKRVREI